MTLARGEEDVILSASELAAAFQLDMPRPGLVRRTSRGLWRLTKVAALLALLLAGGAATAFYLKPEWYQLAKDHSKPYLDKGETLVAQWVGQLQKKPAALEDLSGLPPITPIQLEPVAQHSSGQATTKSDTTSPEEAELATSTTQPQPRLARVSPSAVTPSVVDSSAAIDALGGGTSVFVPTTKPVTSPPQTVSDFPKMIDTILAKQEAARSNQPAVAAPVPPPQPEPAKPADKTFNVSSMTLEEAIATAATLRTSALDAEARKDWAAAVLIYEQIAKLPEGAHPSDLKVKLTVARDRAKS